jgi:hypothetical protein
MFMFRVRPHTRACRYRKIRPIRPNPPERCQLNDLAANRIHPFRVGREDQKGISPASFTSIFFPVSSILIG